MSMMRNYVVLRKWPGNAGWYQFTAQYARNRESAIRQALLKEDPNDLAEDYKAIPTRAWNQDPWVRP